MKLSLQLRLPFNPGRVLNTPKKSITTHESVVCCECDCFCDDIQIHIESNTVVDIDHACSIGEAFFLGRTEQAHWECIADKRTIPFEDGVTQASQLLTNANYPIVFGIQNCVSEAQQLAIKLARRTSTLVDIAANGPSSKFLHAMQHAGQVTCTFGEVKNRSDLLIFWGTDPARNQPRFFERIGNSSGGRFNNDKNQRRIAIHSGLNETQKIADTSIEIKKGSDLSCLLFLRALCNGIRVETKFLEAESGVSNNCWKQLFDDITSSNHVTFLVGNSFSQSPIGSILYETLNRLVIDLNAHTRAFVLQVDGHRNSNGAELISSWLSAYPASVRFRNCIGEYNCEEFSAENSLANKEADAALIIGNASLDYLSDQARERLTSIPLVSIETEAGRPISNEVKQIRFAAKTFAIEEAGTVYRGDKVPLPVNSLITSPNRSAAQILNAILNSL